jgi:hypothetical protein
MLVLLPQYIISFFMSDDDGSIFYSSQITLWFLRQTVPKYSRSISILHGTVFSLVNSGNTKDMHSVSVCNHLS